MDDAWGSLAPVDNHLIASVRLPELITRSNLILCKATGWHGRDIYNTRQMHRFLLAGRPFPLRPDGGRNDSKGSQVVEMECASRSFSW